MVRPTAPRASLLGLAPGGVCRAADVATRAVRSYRTISPLPAPLARHLGGIFLLHFPWARAPQALPGTVPYGARTFLHPCPLTRARTATAWPTLGRNHTQISLRMRGGFVLEGQRPLVGLIVAHVGDLRGQSRGLFERQFSHQWLEHAIQNAAVPIGAAVLVRLLRSARQSQDDFSAGEIRVG